jgi:competence ComEA-like helix-hairpin-helix protein
VPTRALAVAVLLVVAGGGWFGWRLLRPSVTAQPGRAPRCAFAVELAEKGVTCWDHRAVPDGVRPGDRLDAAGRPVGRMTPEALAAFEVPIDPNRADAVELTSLDGIGPQLAQRILAERARGGAFKSVDELRRVSGIGEKTLARIRERLVVGP